MIHKVRIDYSKSHAPGLFVIRSNSSGTITGENRCLTYRQMLHGALAAKKALPTTKRRETGKRETRTPTKP